MQKTDKQVQLLKDTIRKRILTINPKWKINKEVEVDKNVFLVMGYNPIFPLKPVWLLKDGKILCINGAAKTITKEYEFSYDFEPHEAITILESKRSFNIIKKIKTLFKRKETQP